MHYSIFFLLPPLLSFFGFSLFLALPLHIGWPFIHVLTDSGIWFEGDVFDHNLSLLGSRVDVVGSFRLGIFWVWLFLFFFLTDFVSLSLIVELDVLHRDLLPFFHEEFVIEQILLILFVHDGILVGAEVLKGELGCRVLFPVSFLELSSLSTLNI